MTSEKNLDQFKKKKERTDYVKAWVANYEISKFLDHINDDSIKYVVFLRCNQFREIEITNHEEKELILKEEKPFGKNVRFLIEFFKPRKLIQCDNNYDAFIQECKQRNIDNVESLYWILDLHGHFNTAFATRIENEMNIVILDTYLSNHCHNPAVSQCFEFVFNCNKK